MGDWRTVPIGDLCSAIYDGPHATPAKTTAGPIFLGISALENGRLNLSDAEHLSEADYVRWTRRVEPVPGDIVFSYETRLGQAARVPADFRCCLGRRMALMRPDSRVVDERYLLYAFLGPQFQDIIRSRAVHGSTVDRILLTEFASFPISVPPIDQQRVIASILGALDDKIELNQRMGETLDALAQAIFQSWFIDFDPVRAKAEGRQPVGMDAETAALFSDTTTDSHVGPIPSNWSAGTVDDLLTPSRELVAPYASPAEEFDHYSIPAFDNGRVARVEPGRAIRSAKLSVPVDSVMVSRLNPRFPRVWLPTKARPRRAIASTEFLVATPRSVLREWLYCLFRSEAISDALMARATGTSGSHQRVRPADIISLPVIKPPPATVEAFGAVVGPMFERQEQLVDESGTLAQLRDTLLPKLISGALRVRGVVP